MDDPVILETTFLIDLERERLRGQEGPAHQFLKRGPNRRLYITFTIAGELAAGPTLSYNPDVGWEYGKAYRYLKENGLLIGSNDLWIAATALAYQMAVLFQPDALNAYPSVAAQLAREQLAGRLRIAPGRISTSSERRTPEMTDLIRAAWGIEPFDCLGLTETGIAVPMAG